MPTIDTHGALHDAHGQYATQGQPAAGYDLSTPAVNPFVEERIAAGDFSPAARDMPLRDTIEAWAEANAVSFAERSKMYDDARLLMRGKPADLVPGDWVDLERLLTRYGARDEHYDVDLMAAQYEHAVVDGVSEWSDGTARIFTDQMNLTVPANEDIEFIPCLDVRCAQCGERCATRTSSVTCAPTARARKTRGANGAAPRTST